MPKNLAHFAINADDVPRARRFYEKVFGWRFKAWGPPGFFQIETGTSDQPGVLGALQGRRELIPGQRTIGFECTIAVDDIDAAIAAATAAGGEVVMPKVVLAGVGTLAFFRDTEGNVVGAMQYDASAT